MKRPNHRIKAKRVRHSPPGTAPGAIVIPSDALDLKLKSFYYNQNEYFERELSGITDIRRHFKSFFEHYHWFDFKGFGNKHFIEHLDECFGMHC